MGNWLYVIEDDTKHFSGETTQKEFVDMEFHEDAFMKMTQFGIGPIKLNEPKRRYLLNQSFTAPPFYFPLGFQLLQDLQEHNSCESLFKECGHVWCYDFF